MPEEEKPKLDEEKPKLDKGQKIMAGIAAALSFSFVIRPMITAVSAIMVFTFNAMLRRYPAEAEKMAGRIMNVYQEASGAWVLFAKQYMENLTGMKMDPEMVKALVGKDISLTAKDMAQGLGEEFLAPMFNMIMPGTGDWDKYRQERGFPKAGKKVSDKILTPQDGVLGAERFLGMNLQFQLQAWMLHFIGDTVSMGSMKSLKDLPNAISWSYGVGWLSWLVMGTPFRFTIADPLERHLNTIFRTKELTPAQVIDAFNSGYVTGEYLWKTMREAGYEEDLVPILMEQGSTKLPTGVLKDEYLHNRISKEEVTKELKRHGYTPKKIEHLFNEWELTRHDKLLDRWGEEAIDTYEKGLIDEATLRENLKEVGWEDVEQGRPIDLQVLTSDLIRKQRGRFTKTEVRNLFMHDLLTNEEVKTYLEQEGYSPENADKIFLWWHEIKNPQ